MPIICPVSNYPCTKCTDYNDVSDYNDQRNESRYLGDEWCQSDATDYESGCYRSDLRCGPENKCICSDYHGLWWIITFSILGILFLLSLAIGLGLAAYFYLKNENRKRKRAQEMRLQMAMYEQPPSTDVDAPPVPGQPYYGRPSPGQQLYLDGTLPGKPNLGPPPGQQQNYGPPPPSQPQEILQAQPSPLPANKSQK